MWAYLISKRVTKASQYMIWFLAGVFYKPVTWQSGLLRRLFDNESVLPIQHKCCYVPAIVIYLLKHGEAVHWNIYDELLWQPKCVSSYNQGNYSLQDILFLILQKLETGNMENKVQCITTVSTKWSRFKQHFHKKMFNW